MKKHISTLLAVFAAWERSSCDGAARYSFPNLADIIVLIDGDGYL